MQVPKSKNCTENGRIIVAVFLNFKRAVETVDRKIMLRTHEEIVVTDIELEWFAYYSETPRQCTKFETNVSTSKKKKNTELSYEDYFGL